MLPIGDHKKLESLEDQTRPRRWIKRLVIVAGIGTVLLCIGWIALIYLSERTESFVGTPVPTCRTFASEASYTEAVEKARDHVQAMMTERNIPGFSAAVSVDEKLVWSEGFGYANLEKKIQVCPQTRFRIASVSKTLTAAAAMKLHEEGRLDLDAPIQRYVPSFSAKGNVITPRQLLCHRSGIRHYRDDNEALNRSHYNSVTESLELFKNDSLLFQPGSDFGYTTYGYVLLSAAIESAAGENFPDTIRKLVFTALGLSNTREEQVGMDSLQQTKFYDYEGRPEDGIIVEAPFVDYSSKWAGGGFRSTAEDLVRFGSALLREGFLKAETLDMMFTVNSRRSIIDGYGLGWMIARDLRFRKAYFHFGATFGGTSLLVIYPKQKVCVALLANLGHARFPFSRIMGIVNSFLSVTLTDE
jgi:CubicO group peptidase (beta-lactamase class C family)